MTVKNTHKTALFGIRPEIIVCLFLVVTIFAVYWQVRNYSFLVYDDGLYVTANHHVQTGLNIESIFWAFSSTSAANWHPLTWLSHMLDVQLYGMNPGAHHLTNVFFHILNTLLLFLVFRRMTRKILQSGLVAVLFALHPLHVESVAWIAERKDVLSTFFWMLTLYSYVWYVEHPGIKRYLSVLLFFLLGLMAKPMLVTLPFVLLLLDYWPLKRFQFLPPKGAAGNSTQRFAPLKMIYEKTPLFALSAASSIVTFIVQHSGGAVGSLESFSFTTRMANASVSYVKYIVKMIWSFRLSVFYPHQGLLPRWQVAGACVLIAAVSLLAIWSFKKRPWFAVGWSWYIGTLIPVIGLVQVGLQAMADRYSYVPLIGLFIILVWGVAELVAKWQYKWIGGTMMATIFVSTLMVVSWIQVGYWANSITLFTHAMNITNNNFLAYNAFGNVLTLQGKLDEAVLHYSEALRIRPNYADAHYNMGHTLALQSDHKEAIRHFRKAIEIKPNYAEACDYLGYELAKQGRHLEAVEHFRKAIEIKPNYAEAHNYLGYELVHLNKLEEAIAHFHKALQIRTNFAEAHYNLGTALVKQDKFDEAIKHYRESLRINPGYAEAYNSIGKIMEQQGELDKAILFFQKALQLKPDFTNAHSNLNRIVRPPK